MRKKLLFLITSPAWGGAERYVARLAAASSERYAVTVMAGGSRGALAASLPADIRYVALPELVHAIDPLGDFKAVVALKRFIDAEQVDLLHCNSSKAGLVGALAAFFSARRPKVVYTAHGWGFMEPRSFAFRAAVYLSELLASGVRDATIVVSEKERAAALRWKLAARTDVHLIPHGLDADELGLLDRAAARTELGVFGVPSDAFVIGTLANAFPSKALPVLIEAFSSAATARAHLIIFGDGPRMNDVRAARAASPVKDRIHLPGAVPEAAKFLKGLDLFVLASVKEGMPWALLEAAAAGLPIITTPVGAIPEMLKNGETAVFVPPGDCRALSDAITKMVNDDTLRNRVAAAVQKTDRHHASDMITRTLRVYDGLRATIVP